MTLFFFFPHFFQYNYFALFLFFPFDFIGGVPFATKQS